MDIQRELKKYYIEPDIAHDQFFMTDEHVLDKIVSFAELSKDDVVLEIGAGVGNLTSKLAERAGRVIAFEIDERFKPFLESMPGNVEVHYENAWEYIQLHGKFRKKKEYNKVVSNLPYSFVEQFLHNLTFLEYDKVILLVPLKFVNKIDNYDVFGSFFRSRVLLEVPKEKFYPVPKTNSAVVELIKLPNPIDTHDLGLFLRQYMYQREDKLVKNSLMEGIIRYAWLVHKKELTKNEARRIVADANLPQEWLEHHPSSKGVYEMVGEKFKNSNQYFS